MIELLPALMIEGGGPPDSPMGIPRHPVARRSGCRRWECQDTRVNCDRQFPAVPRQIYPETVVVVHGQTTPGSGLTTTNWRRN